MTRFGRLDVAFNNAGINIAAAPIAESTNAAWQRIVGINLTGVFLCMKYEIAAMKRTGGGAIINTASVGGLIGTAGVTAYCATKRGVDRAYQVRRARPPSRMNSHQCHLSRRQRAAMLEEWFKDPEVERAAVAGTPIDRMADPAKSRERCCSWRRTSLRSWSVTRSSPMVDSPRSSQPARRQLRQIDKTDPTNEMDPTFNTLVQPYHPAAK